MKLMPNSSSRASLEGVSVLAATVLGVYTTPYLWSAMLCVEGMRGISVWAYQY